MNRFNIVRVVMFSCRERMDMHVQQASRNQGVWGSWVAVAGMTRKCGGEPRNGPTPLCCSDFLCPESGPQILLHLLTRSRFGA